MHNNDLDLDAKHTIMQAYMNELEMARKDGNRTAECACLQDAIDHLERMIDLSQGPRSSKPNSTPNMGSINVESGCKTTKIN